MPTFTTNYGFAKPIVNDPIDEDLWGGYLNDDLDEIDTLFKQLFDNLAAAIPTGVYFPYAGATAPSLFLLMYGQAVSRTTYSDLFALVGTTYGSGDGTTTFNIPDMRGRTVAGRDNMGGTAAGRITNTGAGNSGINGTTLGAAGGLDRTPLTIAQLPTLTITTQIPFYSSGGMNNGYLGPGSGANGLIPWNSNPIGSGEAHTNMQPTMIGNYILRY